MKKQIYLTLVISMMLLSNGFGQVSGLSGWNIFLDPGHSQKENMGIYNYSEAEKNLGVGLELQEMLLSETDIDTVYICRSDDQQYLGLYDRTHMANVLGAAWYHSIHSNAGAETSNNTLMLWGQLYNGSEKTPTGGKAMSEIMIDMLTEGMRIPSSGSYGDCSFYTWSNYCRDYGGPYLYVNRNTSMTSELSEAGYHTHPMQNMRNMNADWKRMEARTFYWSILQYHGIEIPKVRILAGIVSNAEGGQAINGARISTGGRTYITDTYGSLFHQYSTDSTLLRNGFYYFEGLDSESDSTEIVFEADNFYSDTLKVLFVDDFITFQDKGLVSKIPPYMVSTYPEQNDTSFSVLDDIKLDFSRPMNTVAVDSALTINPAISGRMYWTNNNKQLVIKPDSLRFNTEYQISIDSTAKDTYRHYIDGNKDGIGGDGFVLNFKTGNDIYPPVLNKYYPSMNLAMVERRPIIRLEYDEIIDPQTIDNDRIKVERFSDKTFITGTFDLYTVNKQSVVHFISDEDLFPGELYVLRIYPGIKDQLGNESTNTYGISFNTGDYDFQPTGIDNFNAGVASWWAPNQSGSTVGIASGTNMGSESVMINPLLNSTASMKLHYVWDTGSDTWLLREYLAGGAPRTVTFNSTYILQAYIFGDNSGNQFRFAIDDDINGSASHEVSPWYTINWSGWKLVSWDMTNDGTGTWLGDGVLKGTLRFDSFQMTFAEAASDTGTVYFDNLRIVKKVPATAIEDRNPEVPREFVLSQNYPNPFNPETRIDYQIPAASSVELLIYNTLGQRVRTLVRQSQAPGSYSIHWDGRNQQGIQVTSGVYFYVLRAGTHLAQKKMILIR